MTATTFINSHEEELRIAEIYIWIMRIIHSCKTKEHLDTATRLAENFEKQTNLYSRASSKLYKGLLDDAVTKKRKYELF
jgi:hypothetical protein